MNFIAILKPFIRENTTNFTNNIPIKIGRHPRGREDPEDLQSNTLLEILLLPPYKEKHEQRSENFLSFFCSLCFQGNNPLRK